MMTKKYFLHDDTMTSEHFRQTIDLAQARSNGSINYTSNWFQIAVVYTVVYTMQIK